MNTEFGAKILSVMLKLQPCYLDKDNSEEERVNLYRPVALAIEHESRGNALKAAIGINIAYEETKLCEYVLEGRCNEGPRGDKECDSGKARGPWQVHEWCEPAWVVRDGTLESYQAGFKCALQLMAHGKKKCENTKWSGWAGAYGIYAGAWCDWQHGEYREQQQSKIYSMLFSRKDS